MGIPMNHLNRFIVLVVALLAVLVGVLTLLVAIDALDPEEIPGDLLVAELEDVAHSTGSDLQANVGFGIALVVGGLFFLMLELKPLGTGPRMVLVSAGEEGVVRIAHESIRELVERTGRGHRSVRGLKCRVRVTSGGLRIRCLVTLNMGSDIPKVSSELQESVDDVVERLTGLSVLDVAVRAKYGGNGDVSLVAR